MTTQALFDFGSHDNAAPQAKRLAPKLKALARQGLYWGTSSWKYEGWIGSIYREARYQTRGKLSKKKFETECLSEYAETFPTVCGDFAFYQFPSSDYWKDLFAQTPSDFVFGFKVPEDITVSTWPTHAHYGAKAGKPNEHFLNATAFSQYFIKRLEPFGSQVGPLIIEFGTFNKSTFATPADFFSRLDPFLDALPGGFRYAVEIRNSEYLTPQYFDLLSKHNVAHTFNAWTRMPGLDEQVQLPGTFTADFTVVRALLRKGKGYEDAVRTFKPYDRIADPNEGARTGLRLVAEEALKDKKSAFVFVNNRLEGNAPSTIEAVVDLLPA